MKRHLNIRDGLGVFEIAPHNAADFLEPPIERVFVDEELVRLRSHIETTRNTLVEGGSVGRKLDFIAQEMNREANTILSKSNDLEVSNCAITLKTEIEKVREQIQNIE